MCQIHCLRIRHSAIYKIIHRKSILQISGDQNGLLIFLIIQCLLARIPELCHHLEEHRPHIVCIQETWLDKTCIDVNIPGYDVLSRRGRHDGENRGGGLTLRRTDFNAVVHIVKATDDERSWHFLKLGADTILLGSWYRPGSTMHDSFSTLYQEISRISSRFQASCW